jgi:hypothetical protein
MQDLGIWLGFCESANNLPGFIRGGTVPDHLHQPLSIFLHWRNPWNNFQVSGNPCIKIIISTAHGTLAWSASCRYNNPIIIVNAVLSREWFFLWICLFWPTSSKNDVYFFLIAISLGTPVEKPWSTQCRSRDRLLSPLTVLSLCHSRNSYGIIPQNKSCSHVSQLVSYPLIFSHKTCAVDQAY